MFKSELQIVKYFRHFRINTPAVLTGKIDGRTDFGIRIRIFTADTDDYPQAFL